MFLKQLTLIFTVCGKFFQVSNADRNCTCPLCSENTLWWFGNYTTPFTLFDNVSLKDFNVSWHKSGKKMSHSPLMKDGFGSLHLHVGSQTCRRWSEAERLFHFPLCSPCCGVFTTLLLGGCESEIKAGEHGHLSQGSDIATQTHLIYRKVSARMCLSSLTSTECVIKIILSDAAEILQGISKPTLFSIDIKRLRFA